MPQPDETGIGQTKAALEAKLGRPVTREEAERALRWHMNVLYLTRRMAEQYERDKNPLPKPRRRRRRNGQLVRPRGPRRGASL